MRRNLIGLAMVAALATGAVIAQTARPRLAQGGLAKGKLPLGANLRQRLIRNLDLSDAQKAQAKTIFQQANQESAPLRAQLKDNRQEMAAAVKNNSTIQIQQLATAAGALQGQAMAIRSSAMAKFYAILTPDQKTKLDQMQGKLQQLFQRRRAAGQTNG
jgi:Spy/CpxP family protein refolding chaperone